MKKEQILDVVANYGKVRKFIQGTVKETIVFYERGELSITTVVPCVYSLVNGGAYTKHYISVNDDGTVKLQESEYKYYHNISLETFLSLPDFKGGVELYVS